MSNYTNQVNGKRALQEHLAPKKDIMKQGEDVMKSVAPGSEVFAVIARDAMETFIKTWNNSMENVIKETIRVEVKSVVQTELQEAVKGVFQGMNEAMANMLPQMMPQPVDTTPIEFDLDSVIPFDELIKRKKIEERLTTGPLSQRVKAEQELAEQEQFIADMPDGSVAMGTKEQLGLEGLDLDGDRQAKAVRKGRATRVKSVDWNDKEAVKLYLFSLLEEAEELGTDLSVGRYFKKLGGRFNTAYQKGLPALFGKTTDKKKGNNPWPQLIDMYRNR